MTDYIEDSQRCEMIQDELAELALGILTGRNRSEVLGHVESCPRCSAELERLSVVADTLLLLGPEVQPPLGFELRLAERLQAENVQAEATHPPRHLGRITLLSAAAAVMAVLGFGFGALVTPGGDNSHGLSATAKLTTANLTSHDGVLGEVMISPGSPPWMFMTVNDGTWPGNVTCQVTYAGGRVQTVGVFWLSGGYGAWGAPLSSSAGQVRSARLVASNGTVLASARLSA
jgi:hypothetical protein